jgi:glycosyltransferase involved in cell wall biosynthesis
MKICFISNSVTWTTGFGQQVRILSKEFAKNGHEVFNICENRLAEDTPWITEIAFAKFQLHSVDEELFRIKPDVCIVLNGSNRAFDCANLVYTGHCKFFFWFAYESLYVSSHHHHSFKECPKDSVVFLSWFHKHVWNHVEGTVIPHCVDVDMLTNPDVENGYKLLAKMGAEPDIPVVVNANRNDVRKRWDKFFQVAQRLNEFDDFQFLVNSSKDGYYDLEQLADIYGVKHCTFFNFNQTYKGLSQEEFRDLLSACSFRVDSSSAEGFGLTVAEVAAIGLPQWVGDHTCMNEILGPDYPKFPQVGLFGSQGKSFYADIDMSGDLIITGSDVKKAKDHVIKNFHPSAVYDKWMNLIESHQIPIDRKWGFNGTSKIGASLVAAAQFCEKVGGRIVEYDTYDGKFVDSCNYLGLDILSVNSGKIPLSERTLTKCVNAENLRPPEGNIAVVNDSSVPPLVLSRYNWLLLRRRVPNKKQDIPGGFYRNPNFSHEIYSKDSSVNPLT